MHFTPGDQGPTVEPPTHLGEFRPYGLDRVHSAERQMGSYEYDASHGLVNITLCHQAVGGTETVEGTSRWIDLTSHREIGSQPFEQPLELLLTWTLEQRMAERGYHEPWAATPTQSGVVVVDGVETAVDFISLGPSEVCVIPAGSPDLRIALVIERSTEPGWRDEPILITQINNLDGYAPPPTTPGR